MRPPFVGLPACFDLRPPALRQEAVAAARRMDLILPVAALANVWLVDTIGTLTRALHTDAGESGHWENEIHPTRGGYGLLAQRWRPEVEARW